MRIPQLVLALGLLLSPAASQAQRASVVSGFVLDASSELPLPNAHVTLTPLGDPSGRVGTSTDLDGGFDLQALAEVSVLEVTYVGFVAHTDTLRAGDSEVTVRLRPDALNINQITVTASRKQQRKLNAPARVTVIGADQIAGKGTALTIADHLQEAPSVDIIRTGLNQSRVVVRGFNDNLASNLLTLVDGRVARAPAVRLTALQLLPTISSDIEQMEVVSGPASALYGPNAANGVVHVLTKSPFDNPGTSFQVSGGEQSLRAGAVRHAAVLSDRWAYKVTAQYYTGRDFDYDSPAEQQARAAAIAAGKDPGLIGVRDFDIANTALTGRLEGRLGSSRGADSPSIIFDVGLTRGNNIEITPTGAAQVDGAQLGYGQVRFTRGRLFVQTYANFLDSGDSYFLRTGESFIDKSRLYVAQVQHSATLGRTDLTYGADWFRTVPRNEGTVSGGYEDEDTMNEPGLYLQADTDLSPKWALTLAGRVDYHDKLEEGYFSPRAAVVYRPRSQHNFRATWNRAFKSPASNQLFGDVLGARDLFGLGGLGAVFGVSGATDLRAQGMITGFTFPRGTNGLPQFTSPFVADPSRLIDLHDPVVVQQMWEVARFSSVAGLAENLVSAGVLGPGADVTAISAALETVLPASVPGVLNQMQVLDLESQTFFPVSDVTDLDPLGVTRTETLELGYQGLLGRGTVLAVDGYWTRVRDFVGPLFVGTPSVFLESGTLFSSLMEQLPSALEDSPAAASALLALDQAALVGGNNGTAAEEIATFVATGVAGAIPFGTVVPQEAFDPGALVLMRRNFGDISLFGLDLSAMQYLSEGVQIGGTFGWVSGDEFRTDGGIATLNAPQVKWGAFSRVARGSWTGQVQIRGAEGYAVRSDVYSGRTPTSSVLDLAVGYTIRRHSRLVLSVTDLMDRGARQFVDVPELGRVGVLRLEVGL